MANTDVVVTQAAKFRPGMLTQKQRKALTAMFIRMAISATGTAPTVAQFKTDISAATSLFAGMPLAHLEASRVAIWQQQAANNCSSAGDSAITTSLKTLLSDAAYLLNLDDDVLDRLLLYLLGKTLGPLT